MEITKDTRGKWIRPSYKNYLANTAAKEDKERAVALSVLVPHEESADQWEEIDEERYQQIKKAKQAAYNVEYPEAEVNQVLNLMTMQINSMDLTDEQSLQFKTLYPKWESFIGKSLEQNYKVLYNDKLYKVRQKINTVLENQAPSIDTAALYEEINETNEGTFEDPIPYNNNMELFEGKFYSQDGITYKCTRNTEQPVYHQLSELVGLYVEMVGA